MAGHRTKNVWLHRASFSLLFLLGSCAETTPASETVDPSRLKITLERTGCYGSCPSYVVTITGKGLVVFTTGDVDLTAEQTKHWSWAMVPGTHRDQVPRKTVDELVSKFLKANFFRLSNTYQSQVTDNPTYILTLDTGTRFKRVVDYVGERAGMPKVVTDLENAVDAAAGTSRWVRGSSDLIPWLDRTKFDFASQAATILALRGIAEADDATLLALVSRGAPLDWQDSKVGVKRPPGIELLEGAIRNGKTAAFNYLADRGWLKRLSFADAAAAFADSAAGCNPAMVDAAVLAGIPIDGGDRKEPSTDEADDKSALANLANSYSCKSDAARIATARRLLAHGADPNRRDSKGETAIFGVESPELLDLLLKHGADASLKDRQGNSAVFGSWTDAIVLRLLEAGASPKGRYFDGRTLLEQMKERPMPRVAAWLARNNRSAVPDRQRS